MGAPEKIRVSYGDTDFGHQGRLADGRLFIAFTTGVMQKGHIFMDRVVAVLHLFDSDGKHLRTESRLGGYCRNYQTFREDRDQAWANADAALHQLLAGLAPFQPEACPIDVRPFGLLIDGVEYGFFFRPIIDKKGEHDWVIHMPRNHWYHPPWDTGDYDT